MVTGGSWPSRVLSWMLVVGQLLVSMPGPAAAALASVDSIAEPLVATVAQTRATSHSGPEPAACGGEAHGFRRRIRRHRCRSSQKRRRRLRSRGRVCSRNRWCRWVRSLAQRTTWLWPRCPLLRAGYNRTSLIEGLLEAHAAFPQVMAGVAAAESRNRARSQRAADEGSSVRSRRPGCSRRGRRSRAVADMAIAHGSSSVGWAKSRELRVLEGLGGREVGGTASELLSGARPS